MLDRKEGEQQDHGCSYIKLFHEDADRNDFYEITEDFMYGKDFNHYMIKFVDEQDPSAPQINYKIMFTPSTYGLRYIVKEYLDHVKVLRRLGGLKTPLTDEEQSRLDKFFEINEWNMLFKSILKNRRVYGDDYLFLRSKNIEGYGKIPHLKRLNAKDTMIVRNPKNREIKEYIYEKETDILTRGTDDNQISATDLKTQVVNMLFTTGKVVVFIDGEAADDGDFESPEQISDIVPVLHFQYSRGDGTDYSEVPSLEFVDSILRLHRIETDISQTNSESAAPQLWISDGDVDTGSTFGARGIAYVNTAQSALMKGKQCIITQLEITNGLESLYTEREGVINALFGSANLLPPAMKEILAKSDSSKVVKYLSLDLIDELRLAYEEISEITKPIWKILFPDRVNEDIALEVPLDISRSSLYDKATYINSNVLTIKEMLREQGKSPKEIEEFMVDLNQQIQMLGGNGLNVVPVISDSLIASKDTAEIIKPTSESEGIDSNLAPNLNTKQGM